MNLLEPLYLSLEGRHPVLELRDFRDKLLALMRHGFEPIKLHRGLPYRRDQLLWLPRLFHELINVSLD